MCISAGTAALISAAVGVASVAASQDSARKARHAQSDAVNEARNAEAQASQNANARVAMRRRALAANSLATGGGMAAPGKTTLGG